MIYQAEFEPSGKRIILETETNILEAAQKAGINVESVCGGQGICKKCKVRVLSGKVSPTSEQEKRYLSDNELEEKYRLACCTTIRSDTRIYVSSLSLARAQKFGLSGIEKKIRLDPPINKRLVYVDEPSLSDLRSDLSRVIHKYEEKYHGTSLLSDLSTIARLTSVLREGQWRITVAIYDEKEIISADPGDTTNRNFGIAVDLGTTKVAAYLVDLLSGETIDSLGAMNPQIAFGEDVMTRVSAILTGPNNDVKMQAAIINLLNQMIKDLCERNKTDKAEILEMVVVANTVMHHIFTRLPVRQIALAPYVPAVSDPLNIKAKELGIELAPGGYVYIAPVIAGFVGPDHVAMLIASGVDSQENNVIALDIGTNTEISLIANGKKVTTCSCASGAAFEGRHIQFGMRAASGAIEHISIDKVTREVLTWTIDEQPAVGICGSGILDVVSELLRAGIINEKGHLYHAIDGVRRSKNNNKKEFVLIPEEKSGLEEDIVITQDDISAVQLAKGAIRAGIEILLENAGITADEITKIIIAGAFGSYINPSSGVSIGMFPNIPLDRFVQVGNAAGVGAKMMLLSQTLREKAIDLARNQINYIELTTYPGFSI